jgi:15-hydroxyprostaglandin dehydrogenase (NAD)
MDFSVWPHPLLVQVSVCDINTEVGEQLVQQMSAKYGKDKVIFCQCDVTDYPQYEGMSSL